MKILLIEDDFNLGEGLIEGMQNQGFAVDWMRDGLAGFNAALLVDYDSIVLDLGLPKLDGMSVLKKLRARKKLMPILLLTAKDAVEDRILGLDAGADDYLSKPFSLEELVARLNALIRRASGRGETQIVYQSIRLDPNARKVYKDEVDLMMSRREYDFLYYLLSNVGKVLTRTQIEEKLYGWQEDIESNTLEVHVHHIRKKTGPDLIKTIRGVGYMIKKEENT